MSKQIIFQKTILTGIICGAMGVTACSTTDNQIVEEDWNVSETMAYEEVLPEELDVICEDEKNCVPSDNYLTNKFVQTEVTNSEEIALSRPAGVKATAVKEKQAKGSATAIEDETIWYTTTGIPEAGSSVSSATEGIAGAAVGTAAMAGENKKATDAQTVRTVTETETSVSVEPGGVSASKPLVVDATGAGMIPLKKVKTTITETTTKVNEEEKIDEENKDFSEMTLAERIKYGEKVHDWAADPGTTLKGLLTEWGEKSGWTVVWKLDRDYHLEAGVIFRGIFTDVSSALIRSFARATPAPIGTFYQGNRVLVISTQEDENER